MACGEEAIGYGSHNNINIYPVILYLCVVGNCHNRWNSKKMWLMLALNASKPAHAAM